MPTRDSGLEPAGAPLARRGARDIAYSQLRQLIVGGELQPGAAIAEIDLAARLGLSRTPLRESVKALETQGFVTRLPNGRLIVTPLSRRGLLDLFATRLAIERLIVRSVGTEATDREIEEILGRIAADIRRSLEVPLPEARNFGERLHYAMAEICPNKVASTILFELRDRIAPYRRIGPDHNPSRRIQAARDHLAIYELVKARRLDAVTRVLEEHIQRAQETALNYLVEDAGAGSQL